ncbi:MULTISPECIES: DivIVA domain-containing protein [Arthrobacter]|jgi:DivIVA domain-containing protein|uniref:Cell wall synthesis protein Wag31 n=1 Tax=Arthrobacter bambusae TaxID=1338426 RepID=A0AAW8DE69_9MICC|nr:MULTISPECIES: DivIVA domain-containing protein [Arthrobacter]MDP9907121.1 DivIVA domain-containing protein [Arthrobacter bambusae]MDQ0132010.1 DivIVA domain-containing protein [Arthrobacter bambusae]MDQ0183363.1 DivIVA domain-containing protein [Arthrobacter bambusae]MDQ0242340.1 DivIVA domain-containing protein [Arthrobacter bambusae]
MALTPEDVVNKRFQPTKFREGYDQDEVDDFLDEIVVELRRLNQENDELRKKLAEGGNPVPASAASAPVVEKVPAPVKADKDAQAKAEAEAKAAEAEKKKEPAVAAAPAPAAPSAGSPSAESAAGLLAMAQQMHDKHVADGEQQKEKIIAEAQIEASSLVNDAQDKSRKILGALEQQRSVLERKVEQLRGFERDYRSRLKAYIEGQLRDLDARGSVAAPEVGEAAAEV